MAEDIVTTLATVANHLILPTEKELTVSGIDSISNSGGGGGGFGTDVDVGDEINRFSRSQLTFAAVMTIIIMIVGIFGNILTTVALLKCPKVRNVAAAFIISLCIADCIFCAAVLPFNAFRFIEGTWTHGDFLCKLVPFIQYGNIGVSLLCIAMITINRYIMIAHHTSYAKIYKRHWIGAMIVFCWVFSYGMQLPTLLSVWGRFGYDEKLGTCSILPDRFGRSSKTALFAIAFVTPCIIIIGCYAKIFWVVHESEVRMRKHAHKQNSIPNNMRSMPSVSTNGTTTTTTTATTGTATTNGTGTSVTAVPTTSGAAARTSQISSSSFDNTSGGAGPGVTEVKQKSLRIKDHRDARAKRNEWRITKMVLAIFLSFVACYLPITIVKVLDRDVHWPGFHIFGYIMLYLSACINPFIYVIMNKQYRQAYKTVLTCKPTRLLPFGGSSNAEMERYRIQVRQQQSYNGITGFPCRAKQQYKQYKSSQSQPIATNATQPIISKYCGAYKYELKNPQQQQSYPIKQFIVEQYKDGSIVTIPTKQYIQHQQQQQPKYYTLQPADNPTSCRIKRPKWTSELQQYQTKQSLKLANEYKPTITNINNNHIIDDEYSAEQQQYQPYFTQLQFDERYDNESPPSKRFSQQQQPPYQQQFAFEQQPYSYTNIQPYKQNEKFIESTTNSKTGTTTSSNSIGDTTIPPKGNTTNTTTAPSNNTNGDLYATVLRNKPKQTTTSTATIRNPAYRINNKPPITTATIYPTPRYSASRYSHSIGRGGYNFRRGRVSCNFPTGRTNFNEFCVPICVNIPTTNDTSDATKIKSDVSFKRHSR